MKAIYRESFTRDLKKIKDEKNLARIDEVLVEIEATASFSEIKNVKK